MTAHPAMPWLAAALAGLCFGTGLGSAWGTPLALLGAGLWAASLRGEGDGWRGAVVGLLAAAGWFRELPDLWNTYGSGWGWPMYAALVVVQAVPFALAGLVLGRCAERHRPLGFALALGAMPLLVRFLPVPLDLATLAAFTPSLLWPVALAGTVGFGLALGGVAGQVRTHPARSAAGLGLWAVLGLAWQQLPLAPPTVEVTLVQPDIGVFDARRASTANLRAERIERLLAEARGVALVPETAWPLRRLPDPGLPAIVGHVGPGPANRLTSLPSGEVFDKRVLLPIAETPLLGVGEVHFQPGDRPRRLRTPAADFAPLICFEDLVPTALAEAAWHGGGPLLLATNDSWLGGAADKHLAASVLATVRTGRWAARPATTGPSAILDPRGRLVTSTPAQEAPTGEGLAVHGAVGLTAPRLAPVLFEPWLALVCAALLAALVRRP